MALSTCFIREGFAIAAASTRRKSREKEVCGASGRPLTELPRYAARRAFAPMRKDFPCGTMAAAAAALLIGACAADCARRAGLGPDLRLRARRRRAGGGYVIQADEPPPPLPEYDQPPIPGAGLLLDAGLLGLEQLRLLLGARSLGRAAATGTIVDAGLLGLCRRRLRLQARLLGSACRILRRDRLRIRLRRRRTIRAAAGTMAASSTTPR